MVECLIKSCFNSTNPEMKEHLDFLLSEHKRYKKDQIDIFWKPKKPIPLAPDCYEIDFLEYMQTSFENSGQFPSENLFRLKFPAAKINFATVSTIPVEDFRVYIANLIRDKLNKISSNFLYNLTSHVAKNGIDDEVQEYVAEIKKRTGKAKKPDIELRQDGRHNYLERLKRPLGLKTGISRLDDSIGGMDTGTVTVIAGFTSHYKTMFAMNVAYNNSYHYGYNIAYLTLETPKEVMYDQLLCRHSYDIKFPMCEFIPQDAIRKQILSHDEMDYLFDVIEPDLHAPYHARDDNGKLMYDDDSNPITKDRGLVTFFDLSDFETFSFEEITNTLETLDDMLDGKLDVVIVDYVQLCKFMEGGASLGSDDNKIINAYIAFFRKLAHGFRSGSQKKQLIVVLLSQINRNSWLKATKNEGRYDLTCLADANELERGAARVITTYTTENMKVTSDAQVQLLKNRHGATLPDPINVFARPDAYVYGEESDIIGQGFGGYLPTNNIMGALSALDDVMGADNATDISDVLN